MGFFNNSIKVSLKFPLNYCESFNEKTSNCNKIYKSSGNPKFQPKTIKHSPTEKKSKPTEKQTKFKILKKENLISWKNKRKAIFQKLLKENKKWNRGKTEKILLLGSFLFQLS